MKYERSRKKPSRFTFTWKKGLQLLVFGALVVAVIFCAKSFRENDQFPIRTVKIAGAHYVDREEMQQAVTPFVKEGFFAVNVDAIKDNLQKFPWINDVSVQRIWPDQLIINISERKPVARWNQESLLSENGEIFVPDLKSIPDGLPNFNGPEGEHIHMLEYFYKINPILTPLHVKIVQFELTKDRTWALQFENGIKIKMGHKDILTRLNHFVKVYAKIVGDRSSDVEYVDLRYVNGLAVKWKTTVRT